jgi:hypothetical protein
MLSRSRVPGRSTDCPVPKSPPAIRSRDDAELAAIALLCLLFARSLDDSSSAHERPVSE